MLRNWPGGATATVRNVGKGASHDAQANLRNLSGDGLLLRDARFDLSNLKPDEARRFAFTFDVDPQLEGKEARMELVITDTELRESVAERITLPVEPPAELTPRGMAPGRRHPGLPYAGSPASIQAR